jgi:hypothetical protein
MADSLEDLKKLSPRERVARLKQIEKENQEEIEKARKMIGESEREIEIEEEMREIPIPQVKAVDIDSLFGQEEKQVFRMKRFVSSPEEQTSAEEQTESSQEEKALEQTVSEEADQVRVEAEAVQYNSALEEAKALAEKFVNAYGTIKQLAGKAASGEYMSRQEEERLRSYHEMAETLYEQKFSPMDDSQKHLLEAGGEIIYKLGLQDRFTW